MSLSARERTELISRGYPPPNLKVEKRNYQMKTWFITGASRGFGALVVETALAQGDTVVATARNAAAITERFGEHPNLLAVTLDVTDEAMAITAVDASMATTETELANAFFLIILRLPGN